MAVGETTLINWCGVCVLVYVCARGRGGQGAKDESKGSRIQCNHDASWTCHGARFVIGLHETVPVDVRPIPELALLVPPRGPKSAILLHHRAEVTSSRHDLSDF